MKKYCLDLYLEYMNDFLTEQAFADHHGMDDARVHRILAIGRRIAYREPKKKLVQLKAAVGIDTACYATKFIEVEESLLQDEAALRAHVTEQLSTLYDDTELSDFEPDWDMQSNFRLVTLGRERDPAGSGEDTLLADVPIERNYHDFGLEISGQLMRNADAPEWIIDLARHYKLIGD